MKDSAGHVLLAGSSELDASAEIFQQTEWIDYHPATAIATAIFINYDAEKGFAKDDVIMLNITGGGESLFAKENRLQ